MLSGHRGTLFEGSNNKDYSIFGYLKGTPLFLEIPIWCFL